MPTATLAPDRRPYRVYTRDKRGLLVHDGLIYWGQHCASKEARKITRVLGHDAEARPAIQPDR
jgi:hypothetical protein